jgi:hypothetical protein
MGEPSSPSSSSPPSTKSALHASALETARSASARRYASVIPGGVRTSIGRANEPARDRALASRADALRAALHTVEGASSPSTAYEYASVLQEQAERCAPEDARLRDELTIRACDAYGKAAAAASKQRIGRSSSDEDDASRAAAHAVLYNWAIALGDRAGRARSSGDDASARHLYDEAIDKYDKATTYVKHGYGGIVTSGGVTTQQATQALNNLGLALQSRAQCVDFESTTTVEDVNRARMARVEFLTRAVDKFRRALRLEPCFDRGVYNLGTAMYALNAEFAALRAGVVGTSAEDDERAYGDMSREYANASAVYVALALANSPSNSVYTQSFALVKHVLPKPYVLDDATFRAASGVRGVDDATALRLVVNAHTLRVMTRDEDPKDPTTGALAINLADVASCEPISDASLAPGGFSFALAARSASAPIMIFTTARAHTRDVWVDTIVLAASLARRHRQRALDAILADD